MPPRPILNKIRDAIVERPKAFQKVVRNPGFVRRFGGLSDEETLKRMPRGYAEDHPLRLEVRDELADVAAQLLYLAMLRLVQSPHADVNALPRLGKVRFHFLTDEEILEIRVLVEQIQRAVDRIVIGERDVGHPAILGDAIDVFRRVVTVPGVGPAEVFENRETGVAMQIGSLEIRIRQHVPGLQFGMIGQPAPHFLQFACP